MTSATKQEPKMTEQNLQGTPIRPCREAPTTLAAFYKAIGIKFHCGDGPPMAWFHVGEQRCVYVTCAFGGIDATDAELVAGLWNLLFDNFPSFSPVPPLLLWRERPSINEEPVQIFGEGPVITREEVQDGLPLPPDYEHDWDSGHYKRVKGTARKRYIYCRVWWEGITFKGNKGEGEQIPPLKR